MKHFKTYGEFLNETTRQKGKDLNKKELRDLLNKAEDMFHNTNWKRVELAKLFNNLNKQDREKLAIDSQVPILKDILRNESVNEGFHTFDGEMAMDLEDRGTKLKRGDKVTLEIQPNYYVIYGPNRKQISLDKIDFDPETLQQYVIYESVNKAKVKVVDILYKDGRKGKVVKVMSDMANVDFGGGDVYGITFRRIKGDQIEESVNENAKDKAKEIFDELMNINGEEIADMDKTECIHTLKMRGITGRKANEICKELLKMTSNIKESVNEKIKQLDMFHDRLPQTPYVGLKISYKENKYQKPKVWTVTKVGKGTFGEYFEYKTEDGKKEKELTSIYRLGLDNGKYSPIKESVNEGRLPKKGTIVKLQPSINLISLIDIKDQDLEVIGYKKTGLISEPEFLIVKDAKGKKHEINPEYIEESVNEAKEISKSNIDMMGSKILGKIKIGTTFVTNGGDYTVTGFGPKSNAFQEFDAERDGKPCKVKLTVMYGVKLEVTDDPRSRVYRKEEMLKSMIFESVLNEENLKYKDTGLEGEYLRDVKNAVKSIKNALKAGNKKSASEVIISNYDIIQQRVQQYGLGPNKYDFLDAVKKLAGIDESVVNEAKMPVNKENIEHYIGAYSVDDDPYDVAVEIGGQYGWSQRDIEKAEKLIRKHYIR